MSEQNVKPQALIDQLKQQHAQFCVQREQTQINLNQLIGAIFACELMIKKHEDAAKVKDESIGDQGHGEVNDQGAEQAA